MLQEINKETACLVVRQFLIYRVRCWHLLKRRNKYLCPVKSTASRSKDLASDILWPCAMSP